MKFSVSFVPKNSMSPKNPMKIWTSKVCHQYVVIICFHEHILLDVYTRSIQMNQRHDHVFLPVLSNSQHHQFINPPSPHSTSRFFLFLSLYWVDITTTISHEWWCASSGTMFCMDEVLVHTTHPRGEGQMRGTSIGLWNRVAWPKNHTYRYWFWRFCPKASMRLGYVYYNGQGGCVIFCRWKTGGCKSLSHTGWNGWSENLRRGTSRKCERFGLWSSNRFLFWTTDNERVKGNTYMWVSVQWKTKC